MSKPAKNIDLTEAAKRITGQTPQSRPAGRRQQPQEGMPADGWQQGGR